MSDYTPDRWVIIEIIHDGEKLHKVFGGWYGGYTGSDSWRMNSGITKVEFENGNPDHINLYGYSGSCYFCHRNSYGMSMLMLSIYESTLKDAEKHNISFRALSEEEANEYIRESVSN